jgi:hypothetical protein
MGADYRGDGFIYYNGMPTIKQKTDLAQREFGGVMFWELSQDARDVGGEPHVYSLLGAIKDSILDEKVYYPVILDNGTIGTYQSSYDGIVGKAVTGVGRYEAGETASIDAGTNGDMIFDGWVIRAGGVTLADPESPQTTFTMPETHVILVATWREAQPEVTVGATVLGFANFNFRLLTIGVVETLGESVKAVGDAFVIPGLTGIVTDTYTVGDYRVHVRIEDTQVVEIRIVE